MKQAIHSKHAPKAIGPYSQAIKSQGLLFVSGQIPLDPKTGLVFGQTIEEQGELVFKHLEALLKEADLDFNHVVKVEVFLKDFNDFSAFNKVYERYFSKEPFPARWAIEAARLPKDVLVEVGCIAAFSVTEE